MASKARLHEPRRLSVLFHPSFGILHDSGYLSSDRKIHPPHCKFIRVNLRYENKHEDIRFMSNNKSYLLCS